MVLYPGFPKKSFFPAERLSPPYPWQPSPPQDRSPEKPKTGAPHQSSQLDIHKFMRLDLPHKITRSAAMKKVMRSSTTLRVFLILTIFAAVNLTIVAAQAACTVIVINQTGYDLKPVKFVHEIGESKKVVGLTPLSNGGSHTFHVTTAGKYRVYGLLTKNGEEKYAKGNLYDFKDRAKYSLTLKKVVFSEEGNSISFISKSDFDNLK
jgi:hypothetical protein